MSARPRRILHIEANEDGTVGGSHQALWDFVTRVDRTRYAPLVLFYQNNRFARRMREAGLDVLAWDDVRAAERHVQETGNRLRKLGGMAGAILRRRRFLRSRGIDLVHVNNSPKVGNDDWLPAARSAGIPIIASAMGDAKGVRGGGVGPRIHRWLFRRFDHVLPDSEYIASAMEALGIPRRRMTVVRHVIAADEFRARATRTPEDMRAELDVPAGRLLAVMVGNVREWKGQHVVVEGLARLTPAVRDRFRMVFVGAVRDEDRDYFARLDARVREAGLAEAVQFTGSRTDVPDLLGAADVAVHASVTPEPGGIVVLEAMAMGTAIVAASLGGQLEFLMPDAGLLHDVTQPQQLADQLTRLANDPALRQALGARARERVTEFAPQRYVEQTQEVYQALLGDG